MKKKAFTLAEVLITLAIIGVVAAMAIPSVISNAQQQEFKTGLRKAVSVLNSAITMNIALEGETPYDNYDLAGYLSRHMSIVTQGSDMSIDKFSGSTGAPGDDQVFGNAYFYTTDGMRYEFIANPHDYYGSYNSKRLYENPDVILCRIGTGAIFLRTYKGKEKTCGGCGSYGLNNNPDNTTKPPCMITVDVNGDRKPTPKNANCRGLECAGSNTYKNSSPTGIKLSDIFSIMITDKQAIPYGIAAQKAMYQAQK